MHRVTTAPGTYRHHGYEIEALSVRVGSSRGWLYWTVFRPDGSALEQVRSLSEAREAIASDRAESLAT